MSRIARSLAAAVVLAISPALLCAGDDFPLPRGIKELGLSGTIYVTHDSPQDLFGVVTIRGGYYVARNQQVGIDATVFAYSRVQDTYLSGFYRYVFAKPERHPSWAPPSAPTFRTTTTSAHRIRSSRAGKSAFAI